MAELVTALAIIFPGPFYGRAAGHTDRRYGVEPLGTDPKGQPVFLKDIWPTQKEIQQTMGDALQSDMFRKSGKGTMGSGQGNINLTTEMGSISLKWYSPAEDGPDSIL